MRHVMERLRGQRHEGVDGGAPAEVPPRLAEAQAEGAETPSLVPGLA
jgi:hypothetical protein